MDKPPAQANDASINGDGSRPRPPHVLLVPYPAQGHMLPLLDLAALLAARGLALTVAVTAGNVPLLAPLLAACPSVATAVLPFPASGCGENTKDLPPGLFRPFMAALASLSGPLLSWCQARPRARRVTAVVSDLFTGWTLPLARELGVPHVAFSSASACYLAMSHSLWRRMPTRHDDDDGTTVVEFPEIPGSPSFPWRQLSWLYRSHVAGDEVSETIRRVFLWSLESSSCFVVNSFAAIEPGCLRVLPGLMMSEKKRVLAVGALSESDAALSCHRGGEHAVAPGEVAAWLDAFEDDGSVLYLCFGSQHALSPAQAARVADALALSQAPFVWAVARGGEAITAMAASLCRGMVIRGWAPQVEILRHRTVGLFLTHCGWSSVLEAAAAGVPMLAWPMGADQFANARVAKEAGVAVAVAEGADAVPDAEKMAGAIVAAFGEEGRPVRARALELGRKAAAAVKEGGSSRSDLEELVRMLTTHVG